MATPEEPQELWQGRALLQALGQEDELVATPGIPPEPDVIGLDLVGTPVVGIEVTEIHPGGESRRQVEGATAAVLRGVGRAHDAAGLPPVLVSVIFTPQFHPAKSERQTVVEQISTTIAANIPVAKGIRISLDSLADGGPPVPNGVEVMNIQLLDAGASFVHAPAFAFIPDITPADVEEGLRRKAPKRMKYNNRYGETWLLLVASGAGPSTWGMIRPDLLSKKFESPFDRLFVMNRLQLAFHELHRRTA